jgi:hypothetical protein
MMMFYQKVKGQKSIHKMGSCVCVRACVCVCGGGGDSHNPSENKDHCLKFWQEFQNDYGMCHVQI